MLGNSCTNRDRINYSRAIHYIHYHSASIKTIRPLSNNNGNSGAYRYYCNTNINWTSHHYHRHSNLSKAKGKENSQSNLEMWFLWCLLPHTFQKVLLLLSTRSSINTSIEEKLSIVCVLDNSIKCSVFFLRTEINN